MNKLDRVITILFAGLMGYALALTIYLFLGLPFAMAVLFGAGVYFCTTIVVAVILSNRPLPPPKM